MIAHSEKDQPLSAYYLHYGCDHDPFPEETDEILHLTPDLNHRLELIRHLLEYSNHLLLVSGQARAGKTALCDLLYREADENWSVCKVTAADQLGVTGIINSLLDNDDQFQREESNTVANTNDLFSWLRSCDRKQIIPVLLLDDAHKLNDDVLVFILQLGQSARDTTGLHIALFCKQPFLLRLEKPCFNEIRTGDIHTVEIPILTYDQTAEYIQFRLQISGSQQDAKALFDDTAIKQIHGVSGGIPGKINALCRQRLQASALQHRDSPKFWLTIQGLCTSRSFLIGIALLFLFSGLTFIFQRNKDFGDTHEQQTIKIALPAEQSLLSDLQQREEAQPMPIQEPEPILVDEMTEPVSEEVYEDPVITGVVNTDAIVAEEKRVSDELLSGGNEIETVTNEQTSLIEGVEDVTRSPSRTHQLEAKIEHVSGLRSSDWLKQQVPVHYVLQLIGAHDQAIILRIINKHKSMKKKLNTFSTVNRNKPWYVLVYGLYKDRDSAVADIPNLPADVQAMSPWPRQIVTIHKALE